VPLAVLAELNVPQEPEGAQLHDTPALLESFVTVAVICVVELMYKVVGTELRLTEIAGGGVVVLLPLLLHATSAEIIPRPIRRNVDFMIFIVRGVPSEFVI
jgi:hypothetical protein